MSSTVRQLAAATAAGRLYYGWPMVAVAALCLFCSGPGQSYTFSVFIDPIGRDLGISRGSIASAYAAATLLAALLLPRTGRLLDRHGPRRTMIAVGALLGVACAVFGAASGILWLAVGFALLRFLGQGATMMCTANLVSRWFSRRRGVAMSLMALGFAASMAIYPPWSELLIDRFGWRVAWVVLGVTTALLMVVPVLLLVVDAPERIGLRMDGVPADASADAGDAASVEARDGANAATGDAPSVEARDGASGAIVGLTLAEARRERAFYLLCLLWFTVGGLVTVCHFFQVTVLEARGLERSVAAGLFTVSAVTMAVTMPLVGRLFDVLRTRVVIAFAMLLIALSLVSLTTVTTSAGGVLYALVFGLANAFMMVMFGYLWPRYFGRAHLGSIQGAGQMVGVVGASISPVPVGFAIDTLGGASVTLRLLALLAALIGAVMAVWLKTPTALPTPSRLE